jgi:hypothetical protein
MRLGVSFALTFVNVSANTADGITEWWRLIRYPNTAFSVPRGFDFRSRL